MTIQNSYERNGIMSSILDNVQPAVKKETKRVVKITAVGLILMWILFAVLHFTMPDKVPLYSIFRRHWRRSSCSSEFFPDGAGSTEGCISF